MSTSCTFPKPTSQAFKIAAAAGYDGVEVMVSTENDSRNPHALRAFSARYGLPVLSIHAPVLLFTQFVWGTKPDEKLERTVELAHEMGARTVVVHPPFRWQGSYATRFEEQVTRLERESGTALAVENMFPWNVAGSQKAYLPGTNPIEMNVDSITLDFSHAALSGENSYDMAIAAGDRLRHLHLCDGEAPDGKKRLFDEHRMPGQGGQPVAKTLRHLTESGWDGLVIAEVNTRSARKDEAKRLHMLRETLEFARTHTAVPAQQPQQ
jgi:sugar phosphate isomerase/epimerase